MDKIFTPYLNRIEQEIDKALPLISNSNWQSATFGKTDSCVNSLHFKPLVETTRSLIDLGGKRWRPLFLVLTAEACGQENLDSAYHMSPLVEFVHTASLIHDDIEDASDTRRGKPAAYITYGMDTAINAGSWLYFEAPICIDTLDSDDETKLRLFKTFSMELRRLHLGQAMDIAWHRDNKYCPAPDEYLAMVKSKTGTLASLAAKIGALTANADDNTVSKAGETAATIGAGFQIIDDVINLTTGNPGKKRGDDIVEGKKSLPVLLFAQKCGTDSSDFKKLSSCFERARAEGIESPAVEEAIELMNSYKVIDEARNKGITFIEQGCSSYMHLFAGNNNSANKITTLFTSMIPAII